MYSAQELDKLVVRIENYPEPGVIFQDITNLLANPTAFGSLIELMAAPFLEQGITHVVGVEARGFLLAGPIAIKLKSGLVPARKVGKLPRETVKAKYELEYGVAEVEIHQDAFGSKAKVLIVDDVLATGGTIEAIIEILSKLKVDIAGVSIFSEITPLQGRAKLGDVRIASVIS